jgi:hypothetical protein
MVGAFVDFNILDRIESRMAIIRPAPSGQRYDVSVELVDDLPLDGTPEGAGEADILVEFNANTTARAKQWHATMDGYSPERKIQALAQLIRQLDKTGHVGGNIDMAVLTDRGIRWVSTKKQCEHNTKY